MAKILITVGVPAEGFNPLKGHEVWYPGEGKAYSTEELLRLLPEADVVLSCKGLSAEEIRAGKRLKLIVCYGAGYDNIDVAEATKQGIPVVNTPNAVTEVTAELAMALMLCLARRVAELDGLMHGGDPSEVFGLGKRMGVSLRGRTLGIVGMGRIGGKVADFGRLMGMRILYAGHRAKDPQEARGAVFVPLAELMRESDFVNVSCPSTPETQGLISRELLFSMKPTAFFINTARGAVVDEPALLDALKQNRLAGAGLDVFMNEPQISREFCKLSNVVMTPHAGTNTLDARNEMALAASRHMLDVLEGRKPQNLVNPEVWPG